MNKENIILVKSFSFALTVVKTGKMLQEKKEFILSKQLIRSGTSVGANVREAQNAQSRKDFIHKLSISQKECDESIYWLELLYQADYLANDQYSILSDQAKELLRILKSIIISSKQNNS
ncbi:MAG: four helix bundle protein [Fluviicola sp.]